MKQNKTLVLCRDAPSIRGALRLACVLEKQSCDSLLLTGESRPLQASPPPSSSME
jgi:hypothetical protein